MLIEVKNTTGTSHLNPPYGYDSWLEYWEFKKGRKAYQCSHCGSSQDLVGAHVQDQIGNKYLVPLCQGCNVGLNGWFKVNGSDLLPID